MQAIDGIGSLGSELIFRIVLLHELGQPCGMIQRNLDETCHAKVSPQLIARITGKADCLVEEWIDSLRASIRET